MGDECLVVNCRIQTNAGRFSLAGSTIPLHQIYFGREVRSIRWDTDSCTLATRLVGHDISLPVECQVVERSKTFVLLAQGLVC